MIRAPCPSVVSRSFWLQQQVTHHHPHINMRCATCVDRGDTTCCWRRALRSKCRPLAVGSLTSHAPLPGHRPHHISLCATCQAIRARFESMNTDEAAVKAAQIARVQRCVYLRRHPHCMREFAARLFPSALERTIWSYIGGPLGTPPNCLIPRAASSLATASTLISTGVLALICILCMSWEHGSRRRVQTLSHTPHHSVLPNSAHVHDVAERRRKTLANLSRLSALSINSPSVLDVAMTTLDVVCCMRSPPHATMTMATHS